MSDAAAGLDVRAYSNIETEEVSILCQDCIDLIEEIDNDGRKEATFQLIEEYEGEDTFKYVSSYRCEKCGKDQNVKDEDYMKPFWDLVDVIPEQVEKGELTKIEGAICVFSYLNVRNNSQAMAKANEVLERIYGNSSS